MQIVLFPYSHVEGVSVQIPAVDALVLPELPLLDDDFPNRFLLCLLLLLCGDQHSSGINIATIPLDGATKKSSIKQHIFSVKEIIAVQLEEAKEIAKEAQEIAKLLKVKLDKQALKLHKQALRLKALKTRRKKRRPRGEKKN